MDKYTEKIIENRSYIINKLLIGLSIFVVPILLISISRALEIGWKPVMTLQIMIALAILFVTYFRAGIPYRLRAIFVVVVTFIVGITGILQWGLLAASIPLLTMVTPLAVIFLGKRAAMVSLGAIAFSLMLIAFYFIGGDTFVSFDVTSYMVSKLSWVNFIITLLFAATVVSIALYYFSESLHRAFDELLQHDQTLDTKVKMQTLQLELQKKEFESIFNTSKDGIAILDLEGRFIKFNSSYCHMLGLNQEEMKEASCFELTIEEDLPSTKEAIETIVEQGSIENFEKRCRHKDGTVVSVNMSAVYLPESKHMLFTTKNISREAHLRRALHQEKEKYWQFMELSADGVFVVNLNGKLIDCSQQAAMMLGYTTQELKELSVFDWEAMHSKEEIFRLIETIPQTPINFETIHRRKDGSLYDASVRAVKIEINHQELIYTTVRDITASKNTEKSKAQLQQIINEYVNYAKTDTQGVILYASDSFYKEFAGNKESFEGKKISIIKSGKTPDWKYQHLWETIGSGKTYKNEIQNRTIDGAYHWYKVEIIPRISEQNEIIGYFSLYQNIDDKVHFKHQSQTDSLTKLHNRQYLNEIESKLHFQDYQVMMIDIDHFKQVNDTYGHTAGDVILRDTAKILQESIRSSDILIRYGGEEFLLLILNPQNNMALTEEVSQKIMVVIQNYTFEHENQLIKLTLSMGIEPNTHRCRTLNEAILHADEMLYLAKRKGRNRIEYYDKKALLLSDRTEKKYTIGQIKEAIDKERLVCHYQPIVDKYGTVVMHEALVRLIDEKGVLMKPISFLPLIKNTNTYIDLTKQVIAYNIKFFKDKNERFTINLRFSDLLNDSIVGILKKEMSAYPRLCEGMTIELLEDEMIDDFHAVKEIMQEFRKKGVRFAIDDFGSGYANFENLFKLDFDYLKIHGELIKNLNQSKQSRNMIQSLTAFAKKANVQTIAEHIEDEMMFESVKAYDIDLYQGYFIGKPQPELI